MANKWLFITGTDTDVGKTLVATGLLAASAKAGLRSAAIKPIAAGCEDTGAGLQNDDALQLQAASSHPLPYQQVNPVALEAAIAPHIAAEEQGKTLSASVWWAIVEAWLCCPSICCWWRALGVGECH